MIDVVLHPNTNFQRRVPVDQLELPDVWGLIMRLEAARKITKEEFVQLCEFRQTAARLLHRLRELSAEQTDKTSLASVTDST